MHVVETSVYRGVKTALSRWKVKIKIKKKHKKTPACFHTQG